MPESPKATSPAMGGAPSASGRILAGFWLAQLIVLALDQASKWLVIESMAPYQSIPLLGKFLQLTFVRNSGAAFSLLAHSSAAPWRLYLLVGVALVTIIVLSIVAYRERAQGLKFILPLALICGGAAGNLIDRLTAGTVVDFIEASFGSYHFPVFNIADSAVCIGVFWILVSGAWPRSHRLARS